MKSIHQFMYLVLALICIGLPSCGATTRSFEQNGTAKLNRSVTVLLAGDSLMESLGPQLKKSLSGYEGLTLIPIGKRSTGLSRPDYYNWPAVLEKHLQETSPDVVVMWVGTNDPQNIHGQTGLGEPCSPAWQKAYVRKMYEIHRLVQKYHARLVWMGPPVMDEEPLNSQLAIINKDMKWLARKTSSYFVDTRPILADARGRYLQSITLPDGSTVELRTRDHVHITEAGNKKVMEKLLPVLTQACSGPLRSDSQPATPSAGQGGASTTGKSTPELKSRMRYPSRN